MPPSLPISPLYLLARTDGLSAARYAEQAGADGILCSAMASPPLSVWTETLHIPVIAGIRRFHAGTAREVEQALAHGATGIALPSAHSAGEVDTFVRLVRQRADTFISVETETLLTQTSALRSIPWTHLHVSETLWTGDTDCPEEEREEREEREAKLRAVPRRMAGRSFGTGSLRPAGCRLTAAEHVHLSSMMAAGGALVVLDLTHDPEPDHIFAYAKAVRDLWTPEPLETMPRAATFHRNRLARPTA
jgi:hypothetical protein